MKSAIHKASIETSRFLGAHYRQEARKSGWPEELVRSLSVSYTPKGFTVRAPEHLHDKIYDHEYGTPAMSPTAAMHRAGNRTTRAEKFFVDRLNDHLGGSYDLPSF